MTDDSIKVRFDNNNVVDIHRVEHEISKVKSTFEMAKINQFPLSGGYAITIHKSQGQTFDWINIKAPYCWDPGQLYVALSRARAVERIHFMEPIRPESLITDPKVVAYYNSLREGYAA
jgi:ATP-dependent exoDNAse (exonuclease V) alpha subunit